MNYFVTIGLIPVYHLVAVLIAAPSWYKCVADPNCTTVIPEPRGTYFPSTIAVVFWRVAFVAILASASVTYEFHYLLGFVFPDSKKWRRLKAIT